MIGDCNLVGDYVIELIANDTGWILVCPPGGG